jgi:hypothetical protein
VASRGHPLYDQFGRTLQDKQRLALEGIGEEQDGAGYEYYEGEDQDDRGVLEFFPRQGQKRVIQDVYMSADDYLLTTVILVPREAKSGGAMIEPEGKCSIEPG